MQLAAVRDFARSSFTNSLWSRPATAIFFTLFPVGVGAGFAEKPVLAAPIILASLIGAVLTAHKGNQDISEFNLGLPALFRDIALMTGLVCASEQIFRLIP